MTREEAIKELKTRYFSMSQCLQVEELHEANEAISIAIEALQTEQKVGKWINAKVGRLFPSNDFRCSECGNILNFDGVNCGRGDANFCPNCGCRMLEEGE